MKCVSGTESFSAIDPVSTADHDTCDHSPVTVHMRIDASRDTQMDSEPRDR